ncbi:hypothetical protein C3F09_06385 [candidate division GN15 bacterium]|uniref:Uncharacterized protein n=1 Tax=candidate division GN15 bacterium TaxID=2072418 RepID=A0A855X1P9_9BACT|nr:MAG: hypothetical protein C3F09_06385 [candidate division GN15 bacterium]
MEQVPKKGMSKGCLVALIIAIALLVIVIALSITCYLKRDAVIKWGTQSALTMVKTQLSKTPVAGVNTEKFGAIVDSFLTRIETEPLDYARYQPFVPILQKVGGDKKIEKGEIAELVDAFVKYYPELEPLSVGVIEETPAATPPDTAAAKPDSMPAAQ